VSRTHRLELDDQTLREWDAVVLASGPDGIVRISVVKVENKGKGFRRLRIAIGD